MVAMRDSQSRRIQFNESGKDGMDFHVHKLSRDRFTRLKEATEERVDHELTNGEFLCILMDIYEFHDEVADDA